jgi:hypothetical protein
MARRAKPRCLRRRGHATGVRLPAAPPLTPATLRSLRRALGQKLVLAHDRELVAGPRDRDERAYRQHVGKRRVTVQPAHGECTPRAREPQSNRRSSRLKLASRRSSRAPTSTSMTTGSVTTSGPLVAISSVSRMSTALPVARSYSTQADVSARITSTCVTHCRPEDRVSRAHLAFPVPHRASWVALQDAEAPGQGYSSKTRSLR